MSKPTIDDVAALAGVARASVSRVLNSQPNVRPELRERVLAAVEQLGYRVNQQARQLAGRKALRIGLVHASDLDSEPNSYFFSALELGATRASARLGVQLVTHVVNQHDVRAGQQIVNQARDDQCDGLILTPPFADDSALLRQLRLCGCRVVCIAAGPDAGDDVDTIAIDEVRAGHDVAAHLLALGHRDFGYIKGPEGHRSAEGRFDGFLRALDQAGIAPGEVRTERGNFTFRSGIDCAQRLLGDGDAQVRRITALVCGNDDMAAGALLAAHKAGLNIPQDIAITGFDDTPVSEIVWPPLTTIHQPLRRMGERAVERLTTALTGDDSTPHRELVPHHLVVRDSSFKST